MPAFVSRLREADLDTCLARLLATNGSAAERFLAAAVPSHLRTSVDRVDRQTRHHGGTGTIDLDITLSNGVRLLCENKIDAGWSVTLDGDRQPERYHRTATRLRAQGITALSVLVAPATYLSGSRHGAIFDAMVAYEVIGENLEGADGALINAAIQQAATPYEPVPNECTGDFFAAYAALAAAEFPALLLKRNPNGGTTRPTASRTIYFEATRMLRRQAGVPHPRISVQAWDSGAASPSAKLMIGGWGKLACAAPPPEALLARGAYLRPAGRSLGLVIDTPALDTQAPFASQTAAARAGLAAVAQLAAWWNAEGAAMAEWHRRAEAVAGALTEVEPRRF